MLILYFCPSMFNEYLSALMFPSVQNDAITFLCNNLHQRFAKTYSFSIIEFYLMVLIMVRLEALFYQKSIRVDFAYCCRCCSLSNRNCFINYHYLPGQLFRLFS